jgi:hypothetical protein
VIRGATREGGERRGAAAVAGPRSPVEVVLMLEVDLAVCAAFVGLQDTAMVIHRPDDDVEITHPTLIDDHVRHQMGATSE